MISKPDVNISILSANNVLDIGTRRNLIVCQTGVATANALVKRLDLKTQAELDTLLGAGSYSRIMVQEWLDSNRIGNNVGAELDMITLLDGASATAATKILTISTAETDTATIAGTITISIVSAKLFTKTISVASGDTASEVATAIVAAYSAVVKPFTMAVGTTPNENDITITATDLGTIGNAYGVEISDVPAGLLTGTAIADGVTGAETPTVTDVMDLVGNRRYQGILWPSDLESSVSEVTTDFLDVRFNASNDILDGVAFMGKVDTLANLVTAVDLLNSQSLVVLGNADTTDTDLKTGPEILHPVDWTAVELMSIRARRLTKGASIGTVVVTTAGNDQFGGKALASLPYFNTPFDGTPVSDSVDLFDGAEQTTLQTSGYSVIGPNKPLTATIAGTIVTTYKTDDAGNVDTSFKYLNFVDTASVCREFLFNNLKSIFSQSRLTDGDLLPNRAMENAASIAAVVKGLLADLKEAVLVRKGRVADKLINDNLVVTIDLANRKATVNGVLPIVTQLETVNMPLKLTFELA